MIKSLEDLPKAGKIGILGGTFDPIHYGHLVLAQEALVVFGLDAVVFIPSGSPPHKAWQSVSNSKHRVAMCEAATAENEHFMVSKIEIERTGHSYTIDTINELKTACPEIELFFIMGADAILEIENWKQFDVLLKSCNFIAATRNGYDTARLEKKIKSLKRRYDAEINSLEIPGVDISASALRQRYKNGLPLRFLVPPSVEQYIVDNNLYKEDEMEIYLRITRQTLKKELGEVRFSHTMGTCEASVRLARVYGVDESKAYLAALLHDCARGLNPADLLKYCKENNIKLDKYMRKNTNPVHALVGAHMAQRRFGVRDKAVLKAINRHTIGGREMSLLDKIIFVADAIEPNRGNFEILKEARIKAEIDLDTALVLALNMKTRNLKSSGEAIHPTSLKMVKQIKQRKKSRRKKNGKR